MEFYYNQHPDHLSKEVRDNPQKRAYALFENTKKFLGALIPQEDHDRLASFQLSPPQNETIEEYIPKLALEVANFLMQYTPERLEEIQKISFQKRFRTLEGNDFLGYEISPYKNSKRICVLIHVRFTFEGKNPVRLFKDGLRLLAKKMKDHPEEFVGVETIIGDSPLITKVPRMLEKKLKFNVQGDHIEMPRKEFENIIWS